MHCVEKKYIVLARLQGISANLKMYVIDFITSRVLLIFPEISGNIRKISGNIKFSEILQPY